MLSLLMVNMVKKTLLIVLLMLVATTCVMAKDPAKAGAIKDLRAVKLKKFLDRYPWSPLRGHEHEILYCADKFGIDYRLFIAIAGAESSYGKRFPKSTKNLTGYNSCNTKFSSVWQNIYETSKLIGTSHYYKKFRKTRDIWDLIYVYKGVPPYSHYHRNLRYALDQITKVDISKELTAQRALLAKAGGGKRMSKKMWFASMNSWLVAPYNEYEARQQKTFNQQIASR